MVVAARNTSVIGLGNMGTAVAEVLAGAGHNLAVWNRTEARSASFSGKARISASVPEACELSDTIFVCLLDYDVGDSLLQAPEVGRALEDKTLIQLSSGTPDEARRSQRWAVDHGISYLDGAILCYPAFVGTPAATVLYAGPPQVFADNIDLLRVLSPEPNHCGDEIGAAAALDLAFLEVFFGSMVAVLHGAALCGSESEGDLKESFFTMVPDWLQIVSAMIPSTRTMVQSGLYQSGNSSMTVNAQAVNHLLRASRHVHIDTTLPETLCTLFQATVANGHADDDLPALYVALAGGSRR
jgi:3-hydroxyisobutyrate dehydrogenase-like beta-hydroxyacid dehydrogenase